MSWKLTSSKYLTSFKADSTRASGVASPYFSNKSLSRDPALTPILIGMLVFTDLHYTSTDVLWFVLPALAVLWWPLATIYRYLNKKESLRGNKDD